MNRWKNIYCYRREGTPMSSLNEPTFAPESRNNNDKALSAEWWDKCIYINYYIHEHSKVPKKHPSVTANTILIILGPQVQAQPVTLYLSKALKTFTLVTPTWYQSWQVDTWMWMWKEASCSLVGQVEKLCVGVAFEYLCPSHACNTQNRKILQQLVCCGGGFRGPR